MDDPILLKAKEALQAATASGDTAKAEAIRTKTIEYLQRRQQAPAVAPVASPEAEPEARTNNPISGAMARAAALGGSILQGINRTGEWLESKIPLGQFGSGEDVTKVAGDGLQRLSDSIGYAPEKEATWEGVKEAASSMDPVALATSLGKFGVHTGLTSLPDMLMAAGPGIAPYLVGRTEEQLQERQKNNDGAPLTAGDYAAALGSAVASAGLERVGAKGVFGATGKNVVSRAGKAAAAEAMTEAPQSAIEYAGQTVGTGKGFDFGEMVDQAAAGAVGGGLSGGMIHTGQEAKQGIGHAKDKAVALAQLPGAMTELDQYPEEFERKLRIAKAFEEEKASVAAANPKAKIDDVQIFRNLWQERFKPTFKKAIEASAAAGDISPAEREQLETALRLSGKHTEELGQADLDAIAAMDLAPVVKQTYINAARDLNEITRNAKFKNEIGPFEHLGNRLKSSGGRLGAAALGYSLGGATPLGPLGGAAAAAGVDAVADKIGRAIDTALGLKTLPIRKGLKGRQLLAQAKGIDPENSLGMLQGAIEDAQSRRQNVVILSRDYLQKKAIKLDAAAKRAEALETKRQETALVKQQETLRRQAEEAQRKAYEAEQRGMIDEGTAWRKAVENALKKLQQGQTEAAQLAAKAAKAEAEAAAKEAELEKYDAEKGTTAKRLGAPRLGGWMRSLMDEGTKRAGVQVMPHDVKEALVEFVRDGRLTEEQVTDLMDDHGAQIDPETKVYYELQDVAALLAARRNGFELTEDALRQAGTKARATKAVGKALNRKKARDAVKALEAEGKAAKKAERPPEEVEKAKERARKGAATRKARRAAQEAQGARPETTQVDTTPEGVSSPGGASTGQESTVRNPQAYQATIDRADRLEQRAVQSAPSPELARIANEVARLKGKKEKALALAKAISEHPQHAAWLVDYVGELAQTGGDKDQ